MTDRISVLGANGFVGAARYRRLLKSRFLVRGGRDQEKLQQCGASESNGLKWVVLYDLSDEDETKHAMQGVCAVVPLTTRVYVMTDQAFDLLQEFRLVNVGWTDQLARSAALLGGLQ